MKKLRLLLITLCVSVLMGSMAVTAYAGGGEEWDGLDPVEPLPAETVDPGEGFTEDGNLVTRDLLYDKATNKQFITVQTSGGNTFYIVIDYDKPTDEDGEQYQTYFLNMVDEADLLAAMQAAGGELPECSCVDKCAVGAINADCAICAVNMSECPVSYTHLDSALFMGATFPQRPEALRLIRAWGFTYKSVAFVWLKKNKKADSWFYGLGFWTRANAEVCLLATKGHPKRQAADIHQFIISPIEAHSKKPDETRDKIVALMGDRPRVELFARQTPPGWDVWGNEVEPTAGLWSRWPEDSGKEDVSCPM